MVLGQGIHEHSPAFSSFKQCSRTVTPPSAARVVYKEDEFNARRDGAHQQRHEEEDELGTVCRS